jgi:uncharacterized protein (TIGR02145 family)
MKRQVVLAFSMILLITQSLWAIEVDSATAKKVGAQYYFEFYASGKSIELEALRPVVKSVLSNRDGKPLIYFINVAPAGYLIVSGDDRAYPVLSYSTVESWTDDIWNDLPPAAIEFIQGYADQIALLISTNLEASKEISQLWEKYLNPEKYTPDKNRQSHSLAAMENLSWNQSEFYNAQCPQTGGIHPAGLNGYGNRCPAGCVAVAMAQIMRYWSWPQTGTNSNSYTDPSNPANPINNVQADPSYGVQSANFGATTYNWGNMPNVLSGPNSDVAQIIRHAGIAVNMDYSYCSSGAYTMNARNAFVDNFGFSADAAVRSKTASISWEAWEGMMKAEILAGRPFYYRGSSADGGHALVCYAFESGNSFYNFKFNWGWGGVHNSTWYTIRNVTGGNLLPFINNQSIIAGLYPNSSNLAFIPCPGSPTISINDQTYNTVLIGNQCWMKENLNIGQMIITGQTPSDNATIEKYCYDDNPENCQIFGGLYTWAEMMGYTDEEGDRGICPAGWHIPTDEDWNILEGTVDSEYPVGDPEWDKTGRRGLDAGGSLKSPGTSVWTSPNTGATNASGFTALPGGNFAGSYGNKSYYAYQWSSSMTNPLSAYYHRYDYNQAKAYRTVRNKDYALSVRCVRNDATVLTANFEADETTANVNTPIHFTDLSVGDPMPGTWTWNFGDLSASTLRHPVHIYTQPGTYNVSLTISNVNGEITSVTKPGFIKVNSNNNGINLQIVETGTQGVVKWIGYQYRNQWQILKTVDDIPVQNHQASITWDSKFLWENDFNDEIIFYGQVDGKKEQIGHIKFEYEHAIEKEYQRNAIIIFHNDAEMSACFPYGSGKKEYDKKWNYYQKGEYPVSMLIPPDNMFPVAFDKLPLLFVHGWGGTFSYKKDPDALPSANQVSYWFTTVKKVNEYGIFQAWQYYYPYDTDIPTLGKCLKSGLNVLKQKYLNSTIGIITHSMGGLVTSEYITSNPDDAKNKVYKVLYSTPPIHGSIGANKHYKTIMGNIVEFSDGKRDRSAPAPRDMALGSEFMWNLHSKNWVNLNGEDGSTVTDDYFVLLGTTKSYFGIGAIVHNESSNHNDGIVSISSGSLTDKQIGFATFNGNHDDGVHMQSKNPNNQNIGNPTLIPQIVKAFFTQNHTAFLDLIKSFPDIHMVVDGNRTIIKPDAANWETINMDEIDFKKGIINFKFPSDTWSKWLWPNVFHVYYKADKKEIVAKIMDLPEWGFLKVGAFIRNENAGEYPSYYYSGLPSFKDECALPFKQGWNKLTIKDYFNHKLAKQHAVKLHYCESKMINFVFGMSKDQGGYADQTDLKEDTILTLKNVLNEEFNTSFWIHPGDTIVNFICRIVSDTLADNLQLKMKTPDGAVLDSSYGNGTYSYDADLLEFSTTIPNPQPGKWELWIESQTPDADTLQYQAIAYLQSNLHAYANNQHEKAATGRDFALRAGLQMETISFSDSLTVQAKIYKPSGFTEVVDVSTNPIQTDSSLIFQYDYPVDSTGYYLVKFNYKGVYNGFRFERAMWYQFEAVDTIPFLNIPDMGLRQQEPHKTLALNQYIYNVDNYDTLYFSSEIISSNLDALQFSSVLDSLALSSYLTTNLADTGSVTMRYTCHFDNKVISDTTVVRILLPDLSINYAEATNTTLLNASEFVINYSVQNSGNCYSGSYDVKYYIARDSALNSTDYCIGSHVIRFHNIDSIMMVSDTVAVPTLDLYGNMILIVKVDAKEEIIETDETNNTAWINLVLNSQICEIPQGWSGISSYFRLVNDTIESIFEPIIEDLVLLQNASGIYWPSQQINTLSTWDSYQGYQIKVSEYLELPLPGVSVNNRTLQISEGWNLIPVLSECAPEVETLFDESALVIVKEVAGSKVYWPAYNIHSLQELLPGKSYFVLMNQNTEIIFPDCNQKSMATTHSSKHPFQPEAFDLFPDTHFTPTAATHTFAIGSAEIFDDKNFRNQLFIGAFDEYGHCFGVAMINKDHSSVTLYGDDPVTGQKDGFAEGEKITFKLLNPENGESSPLDFLPDATLPDHDGTFKTNGLSAITCFASAGRFLEYNVGTHFNLSPNPADDLLTVTKDFDDMVQISIQTVQGVVTYNSIFSSQKMSIDVSGFSPGIYLFTLTNNQTSSIRKLIIR